jgi:excinuclease UvrABC nuclease subunit
MKLHVPVKFSNPKLHAMLPPGGGVYLVTRSVRGKREIMYVGKAKSLRGRLYSNLLNGQIRSHTLARKCLTHHLLKDKTAVKQFLQKQCSVQWVCEADPKERSFVEHHFIAHFRSPLND